MLSANPGKKSKSTLHSNNYENPFNGTYYGNLNNLLIKGNESKGSLIIFESI